MTISVKSILERARTQLLDPNSNRWETLELVKYINDGQREIVLYKPDASVSNTTLNLSAGTKQNLPADTVRLITVVRNDTADSKRAVRAVSRETLDRLKPNWHGETQSSEVQHFVFDEADQTRFYVYPANNGSGAVEIVYTSQPATVSDVDNLTVNDAYANVVLDYVLYRAFGKDSDIPSAANRSTTHYNAFMNALTGIQQVDVGISPQIEPVNVPGQ